MEIYTNKNNELIASSLRELEKIDHSTYYAVGDNVLADAALPTLAANQAYLVSGERNKEGHFTVSGNVSVIADFRDAEVFDTETGEKVEHTELGDLPDNFTDKPRPTTYHTWNGSKWTLTVAAKKKQLAESKAAKIAEIRNTAEAFVSAAVGIDEYPEFEQKSWLKQEAEAMAWAADNSVETPMLTAIATNRGVPVDILRQKALLKAQAVDALTGAIMGQRQKLCDQVEAATTLAAVTAIEVVFNYG